MTKCHRYFITCICYGVIDLQTKFSSPFIPRETLTAFQLNITLIMRKSVHPNQVFVLKVNMLLTDFDCKIEFYIAVNVFIQHLMVKMLDEGTSEKTSFL